MDSDKNSKILELQLKTLGKKIRIDILKKLTTSSIPLTFSTLQKEIGKNSPTSINFSFHLNALKKCDLVNSSEDGYSISILGKKIMGKILSIEQLLTNQNKTIMIRTSKYSKEPFDAGKITEYLIREGELEKNLAIKIAQVVKERLSKTNIEYLTAPLMREYINGILLENGLEQVRHKLTRLGTPPFEVFKLFNSMINKHQNPERFINKLGSDVSEQFLLLNLLPNKLADMYLSGEVALLHLNHWALRPLSIYLNTDSVINLISKKSSNKIKNSIDLVNLILRAMDVLYSFNPFFSEDLLLGDFNKNFLSLFSLKKIGKISNLFSTLVSQILRYNKSFEDKRRYISLEFSYSNKDDLNDDYFSQFQIDNLFLNILNQKTIFNGHMLNPLIMLDYSKFNLSNFKLNFLEGANSTILKNDIVFYNKESSSLMNSNVIKIKKNDASKRFYDVIIMDKILINLYLIAKESNQNDDVFQDLIQDRVKSVFEFFKYKELLVKKKLNSLKGWKRLISQLNGIDVNDWNKDAIKSISFLGLNEAIKNHCGIELDRIEKSEKFALNILSLIKDLIDEKNDKDNDTFVLSQPQHDKYSFNSIKNGTMKLNKNLSPYSSRIIRKDSNLPLDKQISLFKKFEEIIKGGSLFSTSIISNDITNEPNLKLLLSSKLNAFRMN